MADLQDILSSGDITNYQESSVAAGNELLTSDEIDTKDAQVLSDAKDYTDTNAGVPYTGATENLDLGAYDIIATDGEFENVTTNEIIDSNGSSGDLGDFLVKGSGGVEWQGKSVTTVNAATYSVLATDKILHVTYTTTGSTLITVPTALITAGFDVVIKDGGGNAGTNNITVEGALSETIDGDTEWLIDGDYDWLRLYSDGSNMFIIG